MQEFRIGGDCKHGRRPGLCKECNVKAMKPEWMPENSCEHKKIEMGASFDTDYKVIEQCATDCPACIWEQASQETARKLLEEIGAHGCLATGNRFIVNKNFWEKLRREVEGEK